MEYLTRRILRGFPNVRAWTATADALQSSMLRLLNTLRTIQPASTRHLFNFVALHIHRGLLDLTRQFAARREPQPAARMDGDDSHASGTTGHAQIPDPLHDSADELELWCRFHEAVGQLPDDEGEVLSRCFYDGRTQVDGAAFLQISERTVRTYWQSACLKLDRLMGGQLPTL